jgi:hypothetical protein
VRANIDAGNAEVIDASNTIVMPGFVDTHRHMWQGFLRNVLPDGSLDDYRNVVQALRRQLPPTTLCRRLFQRARRHRYRDLRARLVAYPTRSHRRRHQGLRDSGAGGVRYGNGQTADGCCGRRRRQVP